MMLSVVAAEPKNSLGRSPKINDCTGVVFGLVASSAIRRFGRFMIIAWTMFVLVDAAASQVPSRATATPRFGDREFSPDQLIDRLSGDAYAVRQLSTHDLWSDESVDEDVLQSAILDPDPEVSERARWILNRRRLGITPEMSVDIIAILENQNGGDETLVELLNHGRFDLVVGELRRRRSQAGHLQRQIRVSAYVEQFYPSYLLLAHRRDCLDDLFEMIQSVAVSPPLCLCRLEWMRSMGVPIDASNRLPEHAKDWPAAQRQRTDAIMTLLMGQRDEAISAADHVVGLAGSFDWAASNTPSIVARFKAATKSELAAPADPAAPDERSEIAAPVEIDITSFSAALLAAYWTCLDQAGDEQALSRANDAYRILRQQMIDTMDEKIGAMLDDESFDLDSQTFETKTSINWIRRACYSLLRTGDTDLALLKLSKIDPLTAAELAIDCGRCVDAESFLSLADSQLALPAKDDAKLWQTFVVSAMQQPAPHDQNFDDIFRGKRFWNQDFRRLFIRFSHLWTTGQRSHAVTIADELWKHLTFLESLPGENLAVASVADEFAEQLSVATHRELIFDLIDRHPGPLNKTLIDVVTDSAAGVSESTFASVSRLLGRLDSSRSLAQRVEMTSQIFQTSQSSRSMPEIDFDPLVAEWLSQRFASRAGVQTDDESSEIQIDTWLELIEMLYRNGQVENADRMFARLQNDPSSTSMLAIAKRYREENEVVRAASIYESLIQRCLNTFDSPKSGPRGLSFADGQVTTEQVIDALVGLHQCQQAFGIEDDDVGPVLTLMRCCPSGTTRDWLVQKMDTTPPQWLLGSIKRWAKLACVGDDITAVYQPALSLQSLASRMPNRTGGEILDSPSYWYSIATMDLHSYTKWWVVTSHRAATIRLDDAIANDDRKSAELAIDAILDVTPLDITLADSTLKKICGAGWKDLGYQTLDRVIEVGREHMKHYPTDFATANNLAWVAAISKRHLDDALRWSRAAVDGHPDSVIYRDTLAEVLFAIGRFKEATVVERACLLDDQDDWHVHQQIERFSAAD